MTPPPVQCAVEVAGRGRCPWAAEPGSDLCPGHRCARLREHCGRIDENNRKFIAMLATNGTGWERRHPALLAEQKQAPRERWHARRAAAEEECRTTVAERTRAEREAVVEQECRVCARTLPLDAFARDKTGPFGRKARCRACQATHDREQRQTR